MRGTVFTGGRDARGNTLVKKIRESAVFKKLEGSKRELNAVCTNPAVFWERQRDRVRLKMKRGSEGVLKRSRNLLHRPDQQKPSHMTAREAPIPQPASFQEKRYGRRKKQERTCKKGRTTKYTLL